MKTLQPLIKDKSALMCQNQQPFTHSVTHFSKSFSNLTTPACHWNHWPKEKRGSVTNSAETISGTSTPMLKPSLNNATGTTARSAKSKPY